MNRKHSTPGQTTTLGVVTTSKTSTAAAIPADIAQLVKKIKQQVLDKSNKSRTGSQPKTQKAEMDDFPKCVESSFSEGEDEGEGEQSTNSTPWQHMSPIDSPMKLVSRNGARNGRLAQTASDFNKSSATSMMSKPRSSRGEVRKPTKQKNDESLEFASEYEFFLHYMWSQKGMFVEDNSDEYNNMRNLQSQESKRSDPVGADTAHRRVTHLNISQNPTFYKGKQLFSGRVPISFNFRIPETLIVSNGQIQRWYYSTEIGDSHGVGQIHIRKSETEWFKLVKDRLDDSITPSMITYRDPAPKQSQIDGEEVPRSTIVIKDIMSAQRTAQMLKHSANKSLPKEVKMMQQMLISADLTPPQPQSNISQPMESTNVAANHEVFEVNWSEKGEMKIYRIRNLLKKKLIHIAQSKSQMTAQLKPIRLKHGTPNPSRAALLKLSVPQQLLYLSFEDNHSIVERTHINPDFGTSNRFQHLDSRKTTDPIDESHPKATSRASKRSSPIRKGITMRATHQSGGFFGSPSRKEQSAADKLALSTITEELEQELHTAFGFMKAQFMLHQMRLEGGTFYFQWVSREKEATRSINQANDKRLYLVYVKNLVVRTQQQSKRIELPRRDILYHKDVLTQHFFNLVMSHEALKVREHNHQSMCSCQVQIDLQPKVRPFIQDVYSKLIASNPGRFNARTMEVTILSAYGFLLDIQDEIDKASRKKELKHVEKVVVRQKQRREMFLDEDQDQCFLCGHSLLQLSSSESPSQQYSLPLVHLLYMPRQEEYLRALGETLPQESREQLIFSNKALPPFLRLLIPTVETVEQYRLLQREKDWIEQVVSLNKDCYKKLSAMIVFLAKQSERLEEVQAEFQEELLQIMKQPARPKKKKRNKSSQMESRNSIGTRNNSVQAAKYNQSPPRSSQFAQ